MCAWQDVKKCVYYWGEDVKSKDYTYDLTDQRKLQDLSEQLCSAVERADFS